MAGRNTSGTRPVGGPVGGRSLVGGAVATVAGVAIRAGGPVLLALFVVGATVGTGIAPVDHTATSLRSQLTGEPPSTVAADGDALVDSDRDGLTNAAERRLGTDPGEIDTDGDGLPDSWEAAGEAPDGTPLPDGSPLRADLYVQLVYADGIEPLSTAEREALVRAWAEMPVENPDGSTGVDVHFVRPADDARLDERVTVRERDAATVERLAQTFYTPEYVGGYGCIAHQVAFVHVETDGLSGVGPAPGYQAFVDGAATDDYGTPYTVRVGTATHELLHNVVGRFGSSSGPGGAVHTDEGWLSHGAFTETQHLSNATAGELADGFADSKYYDRRC